MVQEYTSTYNVLFRVVAVAPSDPKDLFMECLTMFTAQSQGRYGYA
jgi:hypothetical protein